MPGSWPSMPHTGYTIHSSPVDPAKRPSQASPVTCIPARTTSTSDPLKYHMSQRLSLLAGTALRPSTQIAWTSNQTCAQRERHSSMVRTGEARSGIKAQAQTDRRTPIPIPMLMPSPHAHVNTLNISSTNGNPFALHELQPLVVHWPLTR